MSIKVHICILKDVILSSCWWIMFKRHANYKHYSNWLHCIYFMESVKFNIYNDYYILKWTQRNITINNFYYNILCVGNSKTIGAIHQTRPYLHQLSSKVKGQPKYLSIGLKFRYFSFNNLSWKSSWVIFKMLVKVGRVGQ